MPYCQFQPIEINGLRVESWLLKHAPLNNCATIQRVSVSKYIEFYVWIDAAMISVRRSFRNQFVYQLTTHWWSKRRLINALVTQAFLGLAVCVFAWGLQYKLSLYETPQAASHQIPKAKLLSKNMQASTAENPLVVRTKTSSRVSYTAPTAIILILLLAITLLNPSTSRRVEKRANRLLHLHRAVLNTLFVRPPPVLV